MNIMARENLNSLYDIVLEKKKKGQVSVGVDKGYSLVSYARISRNPLVKLFHVFVFLYTYPFTIVGAIAAFVFVKCYLCILYYLVGVFALILIEDFFQQKMAVQSSLRDRETFDEMRRRGVLKIHEVREADMQAKK